MVKTIGTEELLYMEIAVALYMFGGGGTGEKARIALNIGHGTV